MSITVTITANSVAELREAFDATIGNTPPAEEKAPPKPRSTKSTKPETTTSATVEPLPEDADPAPAATTNSAATVSEDVDLTPKAIKARAQLFAQKFGPTKLIDTQKAAGSPDGKWSQIEGDETRLAALSELMTAEGF